MSYFEVVNQGSKKTRLILKLELDASDRITGIEVKCPLTGDIQTVPIIDIEQKIRNGETKLII